MTNRTVLLTAGVAAAIGGALALAPGDRVDVSGGPAEVAIVDAGTAYIGQLRGGVIVGDPCDSNDPGDDPCGRWVQLVEADGGMGAPVCVETLASCSDGGR